MNVVIVDADDSNVDFLKSNLPKLNNLNIINTYSSGTKALNEIRKSKIDLILLGADLEDMRGFEFLSMLENPPLVVLISSKPNDAVKAFEYNILDYVEKPLQFPRLIRAVERALTVHEAVEYESNNSSVVFFRSELKTIRIALDEIIYVEALADYVIIVTENNKFIVHTTMKSLEVKLGGGNFLRVHRSYIVNINKIDYIEGNDIYISLKTIPIGASYKELLYENIKFLF
ncbi:MAG TPA: LytTR family DNA-binding domain-containing protein [Cytophagales bacterium]|nr:LytTR family DNA-binding domain-containing protein [Cytophagales bacterium]